jgi:hypothetical protein
MRYDSPGPDYYEPPDDDVHECCGVWCIDASHRDD